MEKSLEDFLALPDVNDITDEVFVSKRLPKFKIRAMSQEDFRDYQRKAQGKIGKNGVDFDATKFNILMVAGQTLSPDFSNADLLKKAGCSTASDLISKKLLAGEIAELARQIQVLSGFDTDMEEDIKEAKN